MTIAAAMNAALSGLNVSSKLANTTANNVANVGTTGYVRRSVSISEASIGGGAVINGISRNNNEAVTQQRREVSGNVAQSTILTNSWTDLSFQIGDTLDGPGLFRTVSDFEAAIASAATSPESPTDANNMLELAIELTTQLNDLSEQVRSQRETADASIKEAVDFINQTLVDIDELNKSIQSAPNGSNQVASLEDQRQLAVDSISEYIPVRTIAREDGTIDIVTEEGVFLIADKAREIEFTLGAGYTSDQTLAGGQLSGLTVAGVDITPGAVSYGAVASGSIAGLFQLRDEDMPELGLQLDTVANDLITRFTDDVGDTTLGTTDYGLFVDPNPTAGDDVAARIQVNALVDPAQGGELWRLRDGIGATVEGDVGNATLLNGMLSAMQTSKAIDENGIQGRFSTAELSAHLSSLAGQKRVSNEAALTASRAEFDRLVEAERDVTGVDLDTELQNLLLIEQAYAANARVIEVTNQLIQELMNL